MSEVFKAYKKARRVGFAVLTKCVDANDDNSKEDLLKRISELEAKNKEYEKIIEDLNYTIEDLESQIVDQASYIEDLEMALSEYEDE